MSATTIADVINVARDMTITALDAGEPVAWVSRAGAPYHHYGGHLHTAVPVRRSERETITGWVVRVNVAGSAWLLVRQSTARSAATKRGGAAWSTAAVRGAILRSVAVVDPTTLPKQTIQPVLPPEDKKAKKGAAKPSKRAARPRRSDEAREALTDAMQADARLHALRVAGEAHRNAMLNLSWFLSDVAGVFARNSALAHGSAGIRAPNRAPNFIPPSIDRLRPRLLDDSQLEDSPPYFACVVRRGNKRIGVVMPGTEVAYGERQHLRYVVVTAVPTGNWGNDLYRTRSLLENTWGRAVETAAEELRS